MNQPLLFGQVEPPAPRVQRPPLPPHAPHSDTSRAGAEAAARHAGRQELQYTELLYSYGILGLTDHIAAQRLGWPVTTVCARRNACKRRGEVVDIGLRPKGPYGVANIGWVHQLHATYEQLLAWESKRAGKGGGA